MLPVSLREVEWKREGINHLLRPYARRSTPLRSTPVAVKAPAIMIRGGAICHAGYEDREKRGGKSVLLMQIESV